MPLGIGAAISPVPTATCLMLLSTNRKPLATATVFLVGSSAALMVVGVLSLVLFGGGGTEGAGITPDVRDTIDAVFGGFFLILAFKLSMKAPDPSAPPPGWESKIGTIGSGRAALFGVVMTVTNFSSLPLFLSGLKEIVAANLGTVESMVVLAGFVLLVEVALVVPTVSYALSPRRAGAVLGTALGWMEKNSRIISISIFLVFGVLLLVKGLLGLRT